MISFGYYITVCSLPLSVISGVIGNKIHPKQYNLVIGYSVSSISIINTFFTSPPAPASKPPLTCHPVESLTPSAMAHPS